MERPTTYVVVRTVIIKIVLNIVQDLFILWHIFYNMNRSNTRNKRDINVGPWHKKFGNEIQKQDRLN